MLKRSFMLANQTTRTFVTIIVPRFPWSLRVDTESFEWFIEYMLSRRRIFGSYPTLSSPYPTVSSTGDTQEDWDRETTCWRERGGMGWGGAQSYDGRESLALCKLVITFWEKKWTDYAGWHLYGSFHIKLVALEVSFACSYLMLINRIEKRYSSFMNTFMLSFFLFTILLANNSRDCIVSVHTAHVRVIFEHRKAWYISEDCTKDTVLVYHNYSITYYQIFIGIQLHER